MIPAIGSGPDERMISRRRPGSELNAGAILRRMRPNPKFAVTDERVVRALIDENPWGTLVSHTDGGLVASHYPVLLDEGSDELAVLTHVGRPDDQLHRFGTGETMLIIAGPHGYISPSWYSEHGTPAPTWNFSVAHCYGIPQILDAEANLRVLTRLMDHFERHVDSPVALDQQFGARLATGTVGIRLPITRFVCKVKMSQDKDPQSQRQVLEALRGPGPYSNELLAAQMQRALAQTPTSSA
jgi:transcriptional regulator